MTSEAQLICAPLAQCVLQGWDALCLAWRLHPFTKHHNLHFEFICLMWGTFPNRAGRMLQGRVALRTWFTSNPYKISHSEKQKTKRAVDMVKVQVIVLARAGRVSQGKGP